MNTKNIEKYAEVMREIKLRTEVITALGSGQAHALYSPATIESTGLQFRKCFELIAFASLSANSLEYSTAYANFSKHWEATKLIKNLRAINPNFYPKPVKEVPSSNPLTVHGLEDRIGDFLTVDELVKAHGLCGRLVHSANPYGKKIDYDFYRVAFPKWHLRMVNLLNNHQVRMPKDTGFYLIHMKENGHDEVCWYRFEQMNMRPN